MRILYQFPLSHFCEKARWLLDYKELDYVAENVLPGFQQMFTHIKTGHKTLPILKNDTDLVSEATQIARYLDNNYPEHNLIRANKKLQTQIFEIDNLANDLGIELEKWLFTALNDVETLDIMLGERGYLRRFEKFTKPVLKSLIKKAPNESELKTAEEKIYTLIDQLNQKIVAQQGRYFVSERLGLADIAVCSMIAPILNIMGTPWENTQLNPTLTALKQHVLGLPIGQYVLRVYATERYARVDWRGI